MPTTRGPDVERLETRVGRPEQALQLTSARAQVPPVLLLGLVVLVSEPFRPAVFALGGVLAVANNPDDGAVQGLGVEPTAQLWLLVALLVWIHLPANQLRETI